MLLKAALNGNRTVQDCRLVPITPEQLATDAQAAVALGIGAIHVHPRDKDGLESLRWEDIEPALLAIREACPGTPIGISSREGITETVAERFELVSDWKEPLDFVSVNFHEAGSVEVARKLPDLNIGVEAGLFTPQAAENLVQSGLAEACLRIMFEPVDPLLEDALKTVNQIEEILNRAKIANPSRLLHGFDATVWDLVAEAKKRGYDTRVGLEDTLFLPDGTVAAEGNVDLVLAAKELLTI